MKLGAWSTRSQHLRKVCQIVCLLVDAADAGLASGKCRTMQQPSGTMMQAAQHHTELRLRWARSLGRAVAAAVEQRLPSACSSFISSAILLTTSRCGIDSRLTPLLTTLSTTQAPVDGTVVMAASAAVVCTLTEEVQRAVTSISKRDIAVLRSCIAESVRDVLLTERTAAAGEAGSKPDAEHVIISTASVAATPAAQERRPGQAQEASSIASNALLAHGSAVHPNKLPCAARTFKQQQQQHIGQVTGKRKAERSFADLLVPKCPEKRSAAPVASGHSGASRSQHCPGSASEPIWPRPGLGRAGGTGCPRIGVHPTSMSAPARQSHAGPSKRSMRQRGVALCSTSKPVAATMLAESDHMHQNSDTQELVHANATPSAFNLCAAQAGPSLQQTQALPGAGSTGCTQLDAVPSLLVHASMQVCMDVLCACLCT